MGRPSFLTAVIWLTILGVTSPALAQDKYFEERYAQALKDRDDGQYEKACPMIKRIVDARTAASFDPGKGLGARVELAVCYEKQGKLASAIEQYSLVETLADAADQKDRVQKAHARVEALRPKVALLTLVAPADLAMVPGLVVRVDENVVDVRSWGTPLPIDPGKHTISVTAPNRRLESQTVDIAQNGVRVSAKLGAPSPVTPAASSPLTGATSARSVGPAAGERVATLTVQSDTERSWQRPVALGGLALGVVALSVGIGLGVDAMSKRDGLRAHCRTDAGSAEDVCDKTGIDLRSAGLTSANVSTVALVGGGVAVAAGLVLWLTAPPAGGKRASTAARIGPTVDGWMAAVQQEW